MQRAARVPSGAGGASGAFCSLFQSETVVSARNFLSQYFELLDGRWSIQARPAHVARGHSWVETGDNLQSIAAKSPNQRQGLHFLSKFKTPQLKMIFG